jgi:hypothetical protein
MPGYQTHAGTVCKTAGRVKCSYQKRKHLLLHKINNMPGKKHKHPQAKEYKMTDYVLRKINNPHMRRVLMDALGVTEFTIARYIQRRSDMLLKKQALDAIMEELKLKEEEIYTVTVNQV